MSNGYVKDLIRYPVDSSGDNLFLPQGITLDPGQRRKIIGGNILKMKCFPMFEKMKKPLRNPRSMHDEAVKEYFSDIETAKSFFTEYLPAEIVNNLDFNTLRICKDSFLDKKLARYFCDILYQANLKKIDIDIFIYLLIDHKSREESFMGFQFLKYMVRR